MQHIALIIMFIFAYIVPDTPADVALKKRKVLFFPYNFPPYTNVLDYNFPPYTDVLDCVVMVWHDLTVPLSDLSRFYLL